MFRLYEKPIVHFNLLFLDSGLQYLAFDLELNFFRFPLS